MTAKCKTAARAEAQAAVGQTIMSGLAVLVVIVTQLAAILAQLAEVLT